MMGAAVAVKIAAGERIGRWTVLDKQLTTDSGAQKWLCRCDCGTERYVLERSLKYGGSESCGCLRRERQAVDGVPDLTGRQFGELTVIRKSDRTDGPRRWVCRCACGAEYEALQTRLFTGRTTRCAGKEHPKHYAHADISGQQFHRLTALNPTGKSDKSGSAIWRCRCICGSEVEVSYNALCYGNQKSCGCRKKEHDKQLNTLLTHVAGTSVDILKSKKLPTDNTTGHKGVYLVRGKYMAKIVFQKKQYILGSYARIEDAVQARKEAEEVLFDAVAQHYDKWKARADMDPAWAADHPVQVIVNQRDHQLSVTLMPVL